MIRITYEYVCDVCQTQIEKDTHRYDLMVPNLTVPLLPHSRHHFVWGDLSAQADLCGTCAAPLMKGRAEMIKEYVKKRESTTGPITPGR